MSAPPATAPDAIGTKAQPKKSWGWKRKTFLWILLSLPLIWLIIGLGLYIGGNISYWQQIFLLRNEPIISAILLVFLAVTYGIAATAKRRQPKGGWQPKNGWPKVVRMPLVLLAVTLAFYASLLIVVFLLPLLTGYSFKTDTSVLIAAAIPLLALLAFFITQSATSLKVKVGSVEVDIEGIARQDENQTVRLESGRASKDHAAISQAAKTTKALKGEARTLIIRFTSTGKEPLSFEALRDYIYDLSKRIPLQNIVFLDERGGYLGFTTVERFKEKYPLFGFEALLKDIDEEDQTQAIASIQHTLFREAPVASPELWTLRSSLIQDQWDSQRRQNNRVYGTSENMTKLGAERKPLQTSTTPEGYRDTILEAYRQIVESGLPAVPLVDENNRFLGIIDKDKVIQELLTQLVKQGTK